MSCPPDVEKEVRELMSPACTLGVNTKLQKVLEKLESCGLLYTTTICPREVLCHPSNRGSSMVNPYNVHRKGSEVLASGVKPALLPPNSLAIEMATEAGASK